MASKPGVLTDWPWKHLGSYKFVLLAPWAIHSTYSYLVKDEKERDLGYFLAFPFLLFRMLHNQIWISISRYRTAKGSNRIVDKAIEFEQVDRETNWDDQILFNGILFYIGLMTLPGASQLPLWRTDGVVLTILLHSGPVEFLYYWLHRALHHHFLYSRYHSHHHSSIVTEPISSVIHPFAEHIAYFVLFAIPMLTTVVTRTGSIASFASYVTYIDLMNNMGHCNFEFIPKLLFSYFPPLKFLMYTPTYHSLHHTQFRTNYSLFMPIYDYIYGTLDKSTDTLYETSLRRPEESPDVVHLTHLTTPESIYHVRVGFAGFASRPYTSKWYLWIMWPWTFWSMMVTWIYGRTFVVERNVLGNLKLQTWAIPKYNIQYFMHWQRESINNLIEDAILEAEERGTKVLSLGLMNQGEELNKSGELYIRRHSELRVKVVDGSSLAVAVVLNTIPKGTTKVLLTASSSKVASSLALTLSQRGIQASSAPLHGLKVIHHTPLRANVPIHWHHTPRRVNVQHVYVPFACITLQRVSVLYEDEYNKLKATLGTDAASNLVLAKPCNIKTWLVGDGLGEEEQLKASKGTLFIPFSQFPPKKMRKDCFYYNTPAMVAPKYLENIDSCENWLPRRVVSAWRIAGIVHGLEGWNVNECGNTMFDIGKIWEATLRHGFHPLKP